MTFDDAREKYLKLLDEEYTKLRAIVADKEWTNTGYPPYKDSLTEIQRIINRICELNEAEVAASR